MATYAALVSLMNNIDQIMNHPRLSASFDDKQFQPLLQKAASLLSFIEANNYGGASKEAQDLEREIASTAHAAEDVIESQLVAQIRKKSLMDAVMKPLLSRYAKKKRRCLLQQKIQDMDAVMKKAHEFKGGKGLGEEQPTPVMKIGETAMVGLDAELCKLLDELTFERPSNLHTISIVGMGGMGKTTLAKNIFENHLIKHHFDLRAWATISQQHNAKETLSQLVRGLGESSNNDLEESCNNDLGESEESSNNDSGKSIIKDLGESSNKDLGESSNKDLGLHLYKSLSGRRYLIILDDIWSIKAWDEVRHFFPNNNNGSRIVLTTRLSDVAKDCGSSPFIMRFLDEYNSRKLFCKVAFKNEPCPPELQGVSEEIVKLCKGLALFIVVMGGLLFKSPKTVEYWKGVVKDIKSSVSYSKGKKESLDVLSLSYTHLPPHLKPCFLYMRVFKEDAQIRVSNVVKLWVAEGFIKPNGSQVLEEIGEGYLKDLIDRNLILIGGLRKNGKIGSCSIHDLLRDLCIRVGEQQEFFHVTKEDNTTQGSWGRVICWRYPNSINGRIPLVRCIMTSNEVRQLKKLELLRVLNFQDKVYSAAELHRHVNLRYLAFKQPYQFLVKNSVWELPSSASFMWSLQTLIIKGMMYSAAVVAPTEFWKMRQLRHVECHQIYLPLPRCNGGDEMLILENLQTLKTALNVCMSEEVCKSIPNIKKLGLLYDCDLQGYDDCLIEDLCNLDHLDKLESLNLNIISMRWPWPDKQLIEKLRFPSSLNKLCLKNCLLEWNDLTVMVGSLPQLQVLVLEACSVDGREWSPVDGQFRHLKFLKIDALWLLHWDADHSHFPVLEKLVLCKLHKLKEIPEGIGDIPTLELIRVERCSESAAISAVKIKEVQLDNGNDSLQIQVRVEVSDVEDFKERVESEGLSISNIQLEIGW